MINERAKKELGNKDIKVLKGILAKSPEALGKGDKEHLTARRDYLTKETLKEYGIKGGKEEPKDPKTDTGPGNNQETGEGGGNDPEGNEPDYSGLNKEKLKKECEKRKIEVAARATKDEMIELLEADDKGELEDDEE